MNADFTTGLVVGWFLGMLTLIIGGIINEERHRRAARRYVRWLRHRDETLRRQRLAQTIKPI